MFVCAYERVTLSPRFRVMSSKALQSLKETLLTFVSQHERKYNALRQPCWSCQSDLLESRSVFSSKKTSTGVFDISASVRHSLF